MLLSFLITSFNVIAQSDTLVFIPKRIATEIVLDLEHYDYLLIENDSLRANINDQGKIIDQKDTVINNQSAIIDTLNSTIETNMAKNLALEVKNRTLTEDLDKSKKNNRILGGTSIGLAILLFLVLL